MKFFVVVVLHESACGICTQRPFSLAEDMDVFSLPSWPSSEVEWEAVTLESFLDDFEIFLAEECLKSFHRILNKFGGYYDTPLKTLDSADSNEVCTLEFHFIPCEEVHKNIFGQH